MWLQAGSDGRAERSRGLGAALLREFRCENEDAERRKRQRGGMRVTVRFDFADRDGPEIPYIPSTINVGVGVENFTQAQAGGDADPVILADDRREIANAHDEIVRPL